jgi:hypothetical protein
MNDNSLIISTYGHIDAVFYTLSAIAMICNSPFMGQLIKFFTVISVSYGVVRAAFESSTNPAYKKHFLRIFTIAIIINGLLLPKYGIVIYDHVSKQYEKVDNLPMGFAVPVGILEGVGYVVTTLFEQSFDMKSHFDYSSYGPTFGASLIQEMKNVKMQDPTLAMNIESFLDRCVLTTAAIGIDFTFDDLFKSNNLWSDLIKPRMKDGIREVSIVQDNGQKLQMGCKSAATLIEKRFNDEIGGVSIMHRFSNFGLANNTNYMKREDARNNASNNVEGNVNTIFNKNLAAVFGSYLGQQTSAQDTIRQLLLMNAFSKYGDYGTLRTIQNQETTWQITGRLAGYYMPMLLTVLKCLAYGMFIFVGPAMVLTANFTHFRTYLMVLASFQLWPALSAILNMFVDLYSAQLFSEMSGRAVTLATFSRIGSIADKIVGVASVLQMSVPYLSWQVMQGSYGVLNTMGANLQASMNSAATATSSELTSGNRSFDNVTMSNVSGFKTDLNSGYKADASELQQASGALMKVTAQGQSISVGGAGIDKMQSDIKYTIRSGDEKQMSKAVNDQESLVKGLSNSFSQAQSKTIDRAADILNTIDDHISSGKSTSASKQITNSKEWAQIKAKADELHNSLNIEKQEAFRMALHAEAGKDGILNIVKKTVGVSGGVSLEKSGSSSSTGTVGKNNSSSDTSNTTEQGGISDQNAHEENVASQLGLSKQQVERYNHSLNETNSLEDRLNFERNRLSSLEHSLQQTRSSGGSYERDVTDEVVAGTAKILGISKHEAITRIAAGDWAARRTADSIHRKMQNEELAATGLTQAMPTKESFVANADKEHANNQTANQNLHENNMYEVNLEISRTKYNVVKTEGALMRENEKMNKTHENKVEQNENTFGNNQQAIQTNLNQTQTFYEGKKKESTVKRVIPILSPDSEEFIEDKDANKQQGAKDHKDDD